MQAQNTETANHTSAAQVVASTLGAVVGLAGDDTTLSLLNTVAYVMLGFMILSPEA